MVLCECGELFVDWYRASINAALDPEMAADVDYLERASTAVCPACGTRYEFGILIADAATGSFQVRDAANSPAPACWRHGEPGFEELLRRARGSNER